MRMNQQFGSAAFAFGKLIDSNLKNLTTLNAECLLVEATKQMLLPFPGDCSLSVLGSVIWVSMRNLEAEGLLQGEISMKNGGEIFLYFLNLESTVCHTQVGPRGERNL